MILRLSDSLSRGLIVAAALCVAAPLSFYSIRMARAAYAAEETSAQGLELATRLEPGNQEYWYRLGHFQQFNLEQPDSAEAVQYLKKAIEIDAHYTDALLDLGTAYELDGHAQEARDAYILAKKSYPASAEVAWRYGNFLLREGDTQAAYPEFRRSLEIDPNRAASAFSRCFRASGNIDDIFDKVLPPIPSAYFDVIKETSDAKQLALAQLVWKRVLKLQPRLTVRDFEPLVSGLLASGDNTTARRIWEEGTEAMYFPALLPLPGSLIWDPSFESGVNGYSFSWRFRPFAEGVTTVVDPTEKLSGNQSLRLTFDGKHNPYIEVACTAALVAPKTNYHFSAWVKTKDLTSDHGIGFHIRSFTPKNLEEPVVRTREVHGTNPWTFIDLPYSTGPDANRAWICVSRERDIDTGVRISGTAWVDDVNLTPRTEEPARR